MAAIHLRWWKKRSSSSRVCVRYYLHVRCAQVQFYETSWPNILSSPFLRLARAYNLRANKEQFYRRIHIFNANVTIDCRRFPYKYKWIIIALIPRRLHLILMPNLHHRVFCIYMVGLKHKRIAFKYFNRNFPQYRWKIWINISSKVKKNTERNLGGNLLNWCGFEICDYKWCDYAFLCSFNWFHNVRLKPWNVTRQRSMLWDARDAYITINQ